MKKLSLSRGGLAVYNKIEMPREVKNMFLPSRAVVPIACGAGETAVSLVQAGDYVQEGQPIASAHSGLSAHAPVPGRVVDVRTSPLPCGSCGDAVVIDMGGRFSIAGKKQPSQWWKSCQPRELIEALDRGGVMNTADGAVSLASEIRRTRKAVQPTLLTRLFNRDPVSCADSLIAELFCSHVIEGAAVVARALGAASVTFITGVYSNTLLPEDFSKQCARVFAESLKGVHPQTQTCAEKYPCGARREIVRSMNKIYPSLTERETLVISASVAKTVYDTIVLGSPVLERYIYAGGSALSESVFLKTRIGTRIGDVIEECGGFCAEPARIIINGLFAGVSIYDLDTPVSKETESITVLAKKTYREDAVSDCAHCGACIRVCPESLNPMKIFTRIRNGRIDEALKEEGGRCVYCGCCAGVCPSRIPLPHVFKRLEEYRRAQAQKGKK